MHSEVDNDFFSRECEVEDDCVDVLADQLISVNYLFYWYIVVSACVDFDARAIHNQLKHTYIRSHIVSSQRHDLI